MQDKTSGKYDDIINLPHHVSRKHPQMSLHERAAQFAPFAALVGHDESIAETARITDQRIELGEDAKIILGEQLRFLSDICYKSPTVKIVFFVPDERKSGGKYISVIGKLVKIDPIESTLNL